MDQVLIVLIIVAGMLSFVVLYNLNNINIKEHRRELFLISYLYGALFAIGFSAFVNWIMYFKLKKINMVESLKSIE